MEKLKEYRTREKYTYQKMSDLVGISKIYYWQIENDKRRLSYELAYKIAKIFKLKPDDIFYQDYKTRIK